MLKKDECCTQIYDICIYAEYLLYLKLKLVENIINELTLY